MCQQCNSQGSEPPGDPAPQWTRRSILALLAASAGTAVGLWSCNQQPKTNKPIPTTFPQTTPDQGLQSLGTAPATTTASSQPASAPSTEPTTRLGVPDLGAQLFPNPADPLGPPVATAGDAPVIVIPRTDWTTAHPNLAQLAPMNKIERITVHHTAGLFAADAWKPTVNQLEAIRDMHTATGANQRNWADIAYHFAVDRAGRVWQARPLAYQGAHVHLHNEHNLGIVCLGDFETQSPSAAQLTSLAAFIAFLRRTYTVPLNEIHTHGELAQTSCPGKKLQAYINRARTQWTA